jgi:hypothetical protein
MLSSVVCCKFTDVSENMLPPSRKSKCNPVNQLTRSNQQTERTAIRKFLSDIGLEMSPERTNSSKEKGKY